METTYEKLNRLLGSMIKARNWNFNLTVQKEGCEFNIPRLNTGDIILTQMDGKLKFRAYRELEDDIDIDDNPRQDAVNRYCFIQIDNIVDVNRHDNRCKNDVYTCYELIDEGGDKYILDFIPTAYEG